MLSLSNILCIFDFFSLQWAHMDLVLFLITAGFGADVVAEANDIGGHSEQSFSR